MSPSSLEIIGLCDICEEYIVENDFEDDSAKRCVNSGYLLNDC